MRTVLALLLLAGTAEAGLYNLNDPAPAYFRNLAEIRNRVTELGALSVPLPPGKEPSPGSLRLLYPQQARALQALLDEGNISTLERVDLSACYIRLGKQREARKALEGANPGHFMVQANLAIAHLMEPDVNLRQAAICQRKVLSLWPKASVFYNSDDLAFLRHCEQALLRLIESRLAESTRSNPPSPVPLDPIFPGFRLEGPKGYFVPEGLPDAVRDRLPANAVAILARLMVWLPRDKRLYWQYGELLAVMGEIKEADKVLRLDLVWEGAAFKNLREHRKVVKQQAELLVALEKKHAAWGLWGACIMLGAPFQPFAPGPARAFPALLGAEMASVAAERGPPQPEQPPPIPPPQPAYPFNLQHVSVSFLFGVLVAVLLGLQWQEWRRHAQAAQQQEPPPEEPPQPAPPRGHDGIKSN